MLMAPAVSVESAAVGSAAAASLHPASFNKLPGPIAVLTSVIRTSGFRGLWLGHTGTLLRETGGGAAWFGTKEAVARFLLSRRQHSEFSGDAPQSAKKPQLHGWESALAGASAGVAYNVALFPADTVKSAMQTEAELRPRGPGQPEASFVSTFRAMYKAGGWRGLYAGCGVTVARAIPSSALIFLIYDKLNHYFS